MANAHYVTNAEPLSPAPFLALPLGAIRPQGWLRQQLVLQAAGLTGHLEEVWDSVGPDSGWLGGPGENWERGPYYLDGLVPLAHLLQDEGLLAKAQRWLEWTLNSQTPDGFFGPADNPDWWPRMVMLKALLQHQEVTGDPRVIPFMTRYFRYQAAHLPQRPLESWGAARAAENILAVYWLYNRTGDSFLLPLAEELHRQGLDWAGLFAEWPYTRPIGFYYDFKRMSAEIAAYPVAKELMRYYTHHVVNVAMGIKNPGLFYQQSHNERHRAAVRQGIESLMRYHGHVAGIFSGDEHLSGRSPAQGTELCAVVEYMFSLQVLLRSLGDVYLADALEKVAYNALPATLTADLCAHQYDQQANQVLVSVAERGWYNNDPDANLFGLEPNFGCCTANLHQGWPKFVQSLWLATPEGGLAAAVYAPCRVTAQVGEGIEVTVEEETAYPFDGTVQLTVRCSQPAHFPLQLRIPSWCEGALVTVQGKASEQAPGGCFHTLERTWNDGDEVTLRLPMPVRLSTWYNNSIGVERGPLVFALRIEEDWRKLRGEEPFADWEVHPASPWNYALVVDPQEPEQGFDLEQSDVSGQPFDLAQAPLLLRARARRLSGWGMEAHSAAPPPASPVAPTGPLEEVTLIPYGAARLRIAEFPYSEE